MASQDTADPEANARLKAYTEIDPDNAERRTTTIRESLATGERGENEVCSVKKNSMRTTLFWNVDHSKSREYYFQQLAAFYRDLSSGQYRETRTIAAKKPVWLIGPGGKPDKKYSLEDFIREDSPIPEESFFQNFRLLHVSSPYAIFYLHDPKEDRIWTPQTGMIYVSTRQDISEPVARLHSQTARNKAPAEELIPMLRKYFL